MPKDWAEEEALLEELGQDGDGSMERALMNPDRRLSENFCDDEDTEPCVPQGQEFDSPPLIRNVHDVERELMVKINQVEQESRVRHEVLNRRIDEAFRLIHARSEEKKS